MATDSPAILYAKLRKTVATDVKSARREFCSLMAEPDEVPAALLELASQPGEGRVRQMIATAARLERLVDRLEPWLRRWLSVEADEFARSAIQSALQIVTAEPVVEEQKAEEMPVAFIETYRFVADRLCHRVQQPLPISSAALAHLERLAQRTTDETMRAELTSVAAKFRSALHRIAHTLEFDVCDGYLEWKLIPLGTWLDSVKSGLASRFGQAKLTVIGTANAKATTIRANDFLLETAFGNLWANAVQATAHLPIAECHIIAELNVHDDSDGRKSLDVLLRDNGPGFPASFVETAFRLQYSTKAETRGRGLLEISDAVRRLQGKVRLVPVAPDEYRIRITFDGKQP